MNSTDVKNALENQISVIQGPPGTGKTQTILNIIANLLILMYMPFPVYISIY